MIQIDAQTPIAITLSAEQWNGVLFVMGEAPVPYKLSAPLIQGIGQQMQAAVAPKPNGAELRSSRGRAEPDPERPVYNPPPA